MEDPAPRTRSAFLAALGAGEDSRQLALLARDLEVLAHPRTRAAGQGYGPVDTLVEFLATTGLVACSEPVRGFQSWFRSLVWAADGALQQSPRGTALGRVEELFGCPADDLAARLDLLLREYPQDRGRLDSRAVRQLYTEVSQLCEDWAFALDEDVERPDGVPRSHQQDELYATEAAVSGAVSPSVPYAERLTVSDLVRETTELLALDRQSLVSWAAWNERSPALGWPVLLAQVQYRLCRLAVTTGDGESALVEAAASNPSVPEPGGRFGRARQLLDAYDGALAALTVDSPGTGFQRIRRSGRLGMAHADLLQLTDLLHALPPDDDRAEALAVLRRCLAVLTYPQQGPLPQWWSTRAPDAAELPLSTWEMRARFPELTELLRLYRAVVDEQSYGEDQDPDTLIRLVCDRYTEVRHSSALHIAVLVGEIAGLCSLFTGDEQVDRALRHLGAEPRRLDAPWWDELTWHSWLRSASASLSASATRS